MNNDKGVSRRAFLSTSAIAATAGLTATGLAAEENGHSDSEVDEPTNLLASN